MAKPYFTVRGPGPSAHEIISKVEEMCNERHNYTPDKLQRQHKEAMENLRELHGLFPLFLVQQKDGILTVIPADIAPLIERIEEMEGTASSLAHALANARQKIQDSVEKVEA